MPDEAEKYLPAQVIDKSFKAGEKGRVLCEGLVRYLSHTHPFKKNRILSLMFFYYKLTQTFVLPLGGNCKRECVSQSIANGSAIPGCN